MYTMIVRPIVTYAAKASQTLVGLQLSTLTKTCLSLEVLMLFTTLHLIINQTAEHTMLHTTEGCGTTNEDLK